MGNLMQTPFSSLLTAEAVAGRLLRSCPFVVWVENPRNGRVFELDATDAEHAVALARNMNRPELGGCTCSTRRVLANGKTRMLRLFAPDLEEAA